MKKALKIAGCVLLALVILVLGYVAYVFLDYHRIEDNLTLTAQGSAASSAQTGVPYTVVSYNIGFGAYEDDYSFFMDGGTESWAWSKERLDENLSHCPNAQGSNGGLLFYSGGGHRFHPQLSPQ